MTTKKRTAILDHLRDDPTFQAAKQKVLALSLAELRDVQRAMRQVYNGKITNDTHGICHNTQGLCANIVRNSAYYVVEYFSYGWQHHSGCVCFPVPDSTKENCHDDLHYWQGEQLIYRQSLMAYIIEQIDLYLAYQAEREGKEADSHEG